MVDETLREDRLHEGDWAVVADGEKALLLENVGDTTHLHLKLVAKREQDNPATREQGTDRPGRSDGTTMGQRSAVEDTDWHRLAKDRFADDLADLLYTQAHRGQFRRLVLVASPHVLGEVRKKLHAEVASRVIAELPETLTNHPIDQIERKLSAYLGQ